MSQVDLSQGKIKVRITRMTRLLAIDYSTDRQEKKEYLTWSSDWFAKNWQGADINPVISHIEGYHLKQTKRLQLGKINSKTGVQQSLYVLGAPLPIYTIPFNKKEVDKVLFGDHSSGPDSINITNPDNVLYYGKFDGIRGMSRFRCHDYTYEQFVTPGWEQFLGLAKRHGGPSNRKQVIPDKPSFIS